MDADSRWTIEQIHPMAQHVVRLAAERVNMTVGEWLSHAILFAAAEQLGHGTNAQHLANGKPPRTDPATQVLPLLRQLTDRIEQAAHKSTTSLVPLRESLDQQLLRLGQMEERARSGEAALATVAAGLHRFTGRVERAEARASSGVEATNAQLAQHGERVGSLLERVQRLEGELTAVGAELRSAASRVISLESRLGDELAQWRQRQEQLAAELARLDRLSRQLEDAIAASRTERAATSPLEHAVMRLTDRVQRLEGDRAVVDGPGRRPAVGTVGYRYGE